MNDQSLRLPKALKASPQADAIRKHLLDSLRPIRPGSDHTLAEMPLTQTLGKVLNAVNLSGRLVRGYELVDKTLNSEAKGMALADSITGESRGARISRLILISSDGSERFYRQIERLLQHHGDRLLVILLTDTGADQLGQMLFGPRSMARLVMITHREAVVKVLTALLPGDCR